MTILCFCGSKAGTRRTPRVCAAEKSAQVYSSQLLALKNSRPGVPGFPRGPVGLVWFGLVLFGLVWFGLVWLGLVWFGLAWFGLVWFGLVWFGLV